MVRRLIRRLFAPEPPAPAPAVRAGGAVWRGQSLPAIGAPQDDLEVEVPVPGTVLLDIREPGELASGVVDGALLLPMDLVPWHVGELPDRLTVYCAAGARSLGVASWLRDQGKEAWSLAGGLSAARLAGHAVHPVPGAGTTVVLPPGWTNDGVDVGGAEAERIDGTWGRVWDEDGLPVRVRLPA